MKIVVTGATGFVGKPLCARLLQSGHQVTALSRDAARAQAALGAQVTSLAWKGSGGNEDDKWKQAIAGAEVVIHLAGESVSGQKWTPEFKAKIRDSRVETTRAIVEAMREGGRSGQALICASAVGYYGDRRDEELTEEAPPGSDFLAEVCSAWEAEAQKAEGGGARVCRMRIGLVLGAGGALERMLRPIPGLPFNPYKLGLGGPIGSGRQWMPWIHLDDVIGLFAWAATNPAVSGAVNVTAPNPVRNRELAQTIGRILHRPAVLPVPGFALKIVLGEFAGALLGGQRALPALAERLGYAFRYAEIHDALVPFV